MSFCLLADRDQVFREAFTSNSSSLAGLVGVTVTSSTLFNTLSSTCSASVVALKCGYGCRRVFLEGMMLCKTGLDMRDIDCTEAFHNALRTAGERNIRQVSAHRQTTTRLPSVVSSLAQTR